MSDHTVSDTVTSDSWSFVFITPNFFEMGTNELESNVWTPDSGVTQVTLSKFYFEYYSTSPTTSTSSASTTSENYSQI